MGLTSAPSASPPQTPTSPWADGTWLRRLAWTTLAVNVLIVLTGGAVRLTQSGLGCSQWPTCSDGQWTPHGATGHHGLIEFGNRMVTFLLVAVAVATFVAARKAVHKRPDTIRLTVVLGLAIPAQAVIGGISVLTGLNPWVVGLHMFVSLIMVGAAVWLIDLVETVPRDPSPPLTRRLAFALVVVAATVLYVGTLVTGSGPWSGDVNARRNGLDAETITHVHTAAVYVLVALTVAVLLVSQRQPQVRAAAVVLLVVELAQGAVGFYQYYNGMPALVIELHLLGAALLAAATARVLVASHPRS